MIKRNSNGQFVKGTSSPNKGRVFSQVERDEISKATRLGMSTEQVRRKLRGKNNAMADPKTRNKMISTIRAQRKIPTQCSNWQGGKTSVTRKLRNCSLTQEWRTKIFERDAYTCQLCFSHGYLEAHHKIPFSVILDLYEIRTFEQAVSCKLLWETTWGITLCEKCHHTLPKR
jgi:5-methylcytosine-specific restriction endonuclease McrA